MAKQINYRVLQAELDEILDNLQQEATSVDDAIKLYERGLEIVNQLQTYLKDSENTVKELQAKFKS